MPSRLAPRLPLLRPLTAALTSGLAIFCAPASPQSPAPVAHTDRPRESAACIIRADSGVPSRSDTVRIALFDSVSSWHGPMPDNAAEAMVFRQAYETLVRFDCEGRMSQGAATSWRSSDSGRSWTFVLRDDLRYWDASPYALSDYLRGRTKAEDSSSPVERVEVIDGQSMRVVLSNADTTPRVLTDLDVAIEPPIGPIPASGWRLGTGQYRPDAGPSAGLIRLIPVDTTTHLPVLEFWQPRGSDPRDLLERGADVMVTTDPALLEYAASRGDRVAVPLPWTQRYSLVFVQPVESLPPSLAPLADSARAPDFRRALSRDAVRAESRAALGGTREGNAEPSDVLCVLDHGTSRRERIVYRLGDRTAQDLAERLVALVPRRYRWRAAGLYPSEFGTALRCRQDVGYVVSKPLAYETFYGAPELPLVDTRARAILRRGSPAWVVDGDGTLRMPLPQDVAP